jgi:hypothetical protein
MAPGNFISDNAKFNYAWPMGAAHRRSQKELDEQILRSNEEGCQ